MSVTLSPDLENLGSNDHLLIDLSSLSKGCLPTPLSADCVDATLGWNDTWNVRLPFTTCAPQDVRTKLSSLLAPQSCIEDVTEVIGSYQPHKVHFYYLHDLFNSNLSEELQSHYLEKVVPGMAQLALRLTGLFKKPIPRLLTGTAGSVTMSQEQAACLLANAFFCTFPEPPFDLRWRKTYFNFECMYKLGRKCKIEKIKCLLHYFDAVLQNMPDGLITIRQHHLEQRVNSDFLTMGWTLCDLEVHEKGRIEDTEDKMIEIDFANQYIGGGVLNAGCVQEEIRFVLSPELIVSMLICERMDDQTAISVIGSWRFNDYTGYGDDFKFVRRNFPATGGRDKFKRSRSEVMAINAMKFGQKPVYQFEERPIYRELVKAYCAFAHHDDLNRPIATGNWGCGVYGGNKQLKSLIQLIVASAHLRSKMVYFTFDDSDLSIRLRDLHVKLIKKQISIERLLRMMLKYKEFSETDKETDLFTYIDKSLDT